MTALSILFISKSFCIPDSPIKQTYEVVQVIEKKEMEVDLLHQIPATGSESKGIRQTIKMKCI